MLKDIVNGELIHRKGIFSRLQPSDWFRHFVKLFGVILWPEALFSLVSLFNGTSTFVGHLMAKLFSYKNSSGTI